MHCKWIINTFIFVIQNVGFIQGDIVEIRQGNRNTVRINKNKHNYGGVIEALADSGHTDFCGGKSQ